MASLSIRTDKKLLEELDNLAEINNTDRATEARKILSDGLLKAKLEVAVKLYRTGNSIGYSAEQVRVSIWDFIEYMEETGQTQHINKDELRKEYKKIIVSE